MARQCLGRGFMRAGVFYQDDEYGRGIRDGFVQSYAVSGGEVLQQLSCGTGQSSSVAELVQLFKDAPDIVILPTYINNAKIILQQWYGLGLGGQWMLSEASFDAQLLSAGAAADGAFVVECGARRSSGFETPIAGTTAQNRRRSRRMPMTRSCCLRLLQSVRTQPHPQQFQAVCGRYRVPAASVWKSARNSTARHGRFSRQAAVLITTEPQG